MIRCIAYLPNGRICGEPASHIDPLRGGMVCAAHIRRFDEDVARNLGERIVQGVGEGDTGGNPPPRIAQPSKEE